MNDPLNAEAAVSPDTSEAVEPRGCGAASPLLLLFDGDEDDEDGGGGGAASALKRRLRSCLGKTWP